jgi:hypothetical protein
MIAPKLKVGKRLPCHLININIQPLFTCLSYQSAPEFYAMMGILNLKELFGENSSEIVAYNLSKHLDPVVVAKII